MQHARPNRLRRAVIYAALATMLGVVSLTLSQCTMVGDNLTGVDLSKGRPTTCIKQCNDFYKLVYDQEQKYHDQASLLCTMNRDACLSSATTPEQQQACQAQFVTCRDNEDARHQAATAYNGQAKIDCQNNCHSQGTGSGG
jgi:hypothetical protein